MDVKREYHKVKTNPTHWKKGESGNPKGRPKKENSITNCIQEILKAHEFDGEQIEGGKTVAWKIAMALIRGALGNDIQFIKEVLDRAEGKAIQMTAPSEDDMKQFQERMIEYEEEFRARSNGQPEEAQ